MLLATGYWATNMIIDLDAKYRIRGTESCWQLEVWSLSKGKPKWTPKKYYKDFASALHEAVQRELRTDPAHGLNEALATIERLTEKYAKIFDDVGRAA